MLRRLVIYKIKHSILEKTRSEWLIATLCVLLAAIFWMFRALAKEYDTVIEIPVYFKYDEERLIPLTKLPETVKANVVGTGWDLIKSSLGLYKEERLEYAIGEKTGRISISSNTWFRMAKEQFPNLKVKEVLSKSSEVSFDRLIAKKIPLKINNIEKHLALGYHLNSLIEFSPDSIAALGAAGELAALPDYITLTLPEKNINKDYSVTLPIPAYGSKNITFTDQQVALNFKVSDKISIRQTVKVEPLNFPEGKTIAAKHQHIGVLVVVSDNHATHFDADSIKLIADYSLLSDDGSTVPVSLVAQPKNVSTVLFNQTFVNVQTR